MESHHRSGYACLLRLGLIPVIPPEELIKAAGRITHAANTGELSRRAAVRFAREAANTARSFIILKSRAGRPPKGVDDATDMENVLEARTMQVDQLRRRLGRVEGAARAIVFQGAPLDLLASALAESDDDWRDLLPARKAMS